MFGGLFRFLFAGCLQPFAGCYYAGMAARLTHTVAFRLTPGEYLALLPFFEQFERGGSEGLRWLINHPEVQEVILRRTQEGTRVLPER